MDRSDVAYLVSEEWEPDEMEVMQPTKSERMVYVQADSVSAREWYEGARIGLNPEARLRMFSGDYQGEQLIRWGVVIWKIYRIYQRRNDVIELYLERRKGTEDPDLQPLHPDVPIL